MEEKEEPILIPFCEGLAEVNATQNRLIEVLRDFIPLVNGNTKTIREAVESASPFAVMLTLGRAMRDVSQDLREYDAILAKLRETVALMKDDTASERRAAKAKIAEIEERRKAVEKRGVETGNKWLVALRQLLGDVRENARLVAKHICRLAAEGNGLDAEIGFLSKADFCGNITDCVLEMSNAAARRRREKAHLKGRETNKTGKRRIG